MERQYGMNTYKQGKTEKGGELFIANDELPGASRKTTYAQKSAAQLALSER
jgi:hypothetical protein